MMIAWRNLFGANFLNSQFSNSKCRPRLSVHRAQLNLNSFAVKREHHHSSSFSTIIIRCSSIQFVSLFLVGESEFWKGIHTASSLSFKFVQILSTSSTIRIGRFEASSVAHAKCCRLLVQRSNWTFETLFPSFRLGRWAASHRLNVTSAPANYCKRITVNRAAPHNICPRRPPVTTTTLCRLIKVSRNSPPHRSRPRPLSSPSQWPTVQPKAVPGVIRPTVQSSNHQINSGLIPKIIQICTVVSWEKRSLAFFCLIVRFWAMWRVWQATSTWNSRLTSLSGRFGWICGWIRPGSSFSFAAYWKASTFKL